MAIVKTALSAAMGLNDNIMTVASATGFAIGYLLRVDNEFMTVGPSYVSASTSVPVVRRGDQGTAQVAHNSLADVAVGLTTDWPVITDVTQIPPGGMATVTITGDATIVYPNTNTLYIIKKASAAAITLSAPATKGTPFVTARFFSETAAAHVITYTPGFYADTTSSDLATFAAKAGASATFLSYADALIGVSALANVTIA